MSKSKDESKRQRILKAASKVFSQNGFATAKINEIARAADVADGTIYLYFRNKDDLLQAVFEYDLEELILEMKQALTAKLSIYDQLLTFVDCHLQTLIADRVFAHVFQSAMQKSNPFLEQNRNLRFKEYLQLLEGIIEAGQDQGLFRKDLNPWLMKHFLFGALSGVVINWAIEPPMMTESSENSVNSFSPALRELSSQIADLFLNALRKPGAVKTEKLLDKTSLSAA